MNTHLAIDQATTQWAFRARVIIQTLVFAEISGLDELHPTVDGCHDLYTREVHITVNDEVWSSVADAQCCTKPDPKGL